MRVSVECATVSEGWLERACTATRRQMGLGTKGEVEEGMRDACAASLNEGGQHVAYEGSGPLGSAETLAHPRGHVADGEVVRLWR